MTLNEILGVAALVGIVLAAFLAHLTIKKGWKVQDFFEITRIAFLMSYDKSRCS